MKKKSPRTSTGYRHPRCYANADANCSTKISKEHFISASLLRRLALNNTVKIAGLAWQEKEEFDIVPVKGLASNILCDGHNSSLSGLDHLIDRFAASIRSFDRKPAMRHVNFNGSEIERWMLKCLIGLCASKNIALQLKPECIDILFRRSEWPDEWGLYFSGLPSTTIYQTDSLLIETRPDMTRSLILAADFFIQGIPFTLIMGKPGDPKTFGVLRPSQLIFESLTATQVIHLSWEAKCSGESMTLMRLGSYDEHPPNWKDWEKNG